MRWIVEELEFGMKAYVVALMYFLASVVSMAMYAIFVVFAPLVFDGDFKMTPVFRVFSTVEYYAFVLAHQVLGRMKPEEKSKDAPPVSKSDT